jgi:hypothetical protein
MEELNMTPHEISSPDPQKVHVSVHVELELIGEEGIERILFSIVPDGQADFPSGYLGEGTPLARAILGKSAGDEIAYEAGDIHRVRILTVTTGAEGPPPLVVKERRSIIRRAVAESERTNAIIFASSFSGKWGDYDPDGIREDWADKPSQ